MTKAILFFLIFLAVEVNSSDKTRIQSSYGIIYAGGKGYNKQVFLRKADTTIAITKFRAWEDIREIIISMDQKYLLVYHRPDKAKAYKLTLINMDSLKEIKSIKLGHAGDYVWTKNNNILFTSGSGSNCFFFVLYDSLLNKITEGGGYCQEVYLKEEIIIAYPCVGVAEGLFEVWSLKDGKKLIEKNFIKKYGNYYCDDIEIMDSSLEVLLVLENNNTIKEKISY